MAGGLRPHRPSRQPFRRSLQARATLTADSPAARGSAARARKSAGALQSHFEARRENFARRVLVRGSDMNARYSISRRQRARVYAAALIVPNSDRALEGATLSAQRLRLPPRDTARLAHDALRYAVACHGLRDRLAARIALGFLVDGIIPRPSAIIQQARRTERRLERSRAREAR